MCSPYKSRSCGMEEGSDEREKHTRVHCNPLQSRPRIATVPELPLLEQTFLLLLKTQESVVFTLLTS
jgi:hypothetical protein